jgi:membrane protein
MRAELAALELRRLSRRRVQRGVAAVAATFTKYDLLTYSSAIAFQVLYAIVPLALLGLAALGVVGWQSLYTEHVAPSLQAALSPDAYRIAHRTVTKIMGEKRFWWTTFGLGTALWGSGAALRSMMTPLNGIYGARENRTWLRRLAISIGGGAAVVVLVVSALLIALLAPLVDLHGIVALGFGILRWAATLALLGCAVAVVLRVVPAKKRPIQWISLGSALSVICWVGATIGFGAYITAVSYASLYGAVAGAVLLLIYLHVSAIAFLLGVVVDALLRDEVRKRRGTG